MLLPLQFHSKTKKRNQIKSMADVVRESKSTVVDASEENTTSKAKTKEEEEELRRIAKLAATTRKPDTLKYIERKLEDKGIHRRDRHPIDGLGVRRPPPKSGHGGKFTWEGPDPEAVNELDPAPPAVDPRDPNYVDEEEEQALQEEVGDVVIGEVEVAKVAEAKEGVARIEVLPPLQPQ